MRGAGVAGRPVGAAGPGQGRSAVSCGGRKWGTTGGVGPGRGFTGHGRPRAAPLTLRAVAVN